MSADRVLVIHSTDEVGCPKTQSNHSHTQALAGDLLLDAIFYVQD